LAQAVNKEYAAISTVEREYSDSVYLAPSTSLIMTSSGAGNTTYPLPRYGDWPRRAHQYEIAEGTDETVGRVVAMVIGCHDGYEDRILKV
jgi:hypothetical protein